ncbi:MAG TPA: cysteine desulfurase-like protein [Pirellulales bacterium]|jgi:cysteine desulfurase family protein (TIGR01976 family)|nr:cysteine desulfurase-like protein [Pirellulales bacterium]
MTKPTFDVAAVRRQFPALAQKHGDREAVFFDGPAGSQVPDRVIAAIGDYLRTMNANHGGVFSTSRRSDALLDEAHRAASDFVGADDPECCYFGANMTSLTFALSRAISRTWNAGDEIMVTRLDHDANITPWVSAARNAGVTVRYIGIRPDCTLDLDDFHKQLSSRTRLVAVGAASNAVGTVNPIAEVAAAAHAVGAKVFCDAVHYAPHRLIDVAAWQVDSLACSAYKFFGPHVGLMWGRRELLESLTAYRLRPAPNDLPGKWMTGTQNHEGIAGVLAAIDYLADLGRSSPAQSRREALVTAYEKIIAYERPLAERLQSGIDRLQQYTSWGNTDTARFGKRVATFSITHRTLPAVEVAQRLDEAGIYVWNGNFYALPLTLALGVEPNGARPHRPAALQYERRSGLLARCFGDDGIAMTLVPALGGRKILVERLAAPSGLDDEPWLAERPFHVVAEGELRLDLPSIDTWLCRATVSRDVLAFGRDFSPLWLSRAGARCNSAQERNPNPRAATDRR